MTAAAVAETRQPQPWVTCDAEIMARRPIAVRVESERRGHAVAITGVGTAANDLITVDDPTWGRRTMRRDHFASNYLGEAQWTATFFTKP